MQSLALQVVPDPGDDRAWQAYASVEVDGTPARLLLDTGTVRSSVPHQDTLAARLEPIAATATSLSGHQREERLVRLGNLRWGSLAVQGLTVGLDPPGWPHPSLLGLDVLGSHACHFRFPQGVLELDGPSPVSESAMFPLVTPADRVPVLPVAFDDRPEGSTGSESSEGSESLVVQAIWDTGSGISFVDRAWAAAHPDLVTYTGGYGSGTDVTGTSGANPRARLAPCRIGRTRFPAQDCGVFDLSPDGSLAMIVGFPLARLAEWYVDFPNGRWYC